MVSEFYVKRGVRASWCMGERDLYFLSKVGGVEGLLSGEKTEVPCSEGFVLAVC